MPDLHTPYTAKTRSRRDDDEDVRVLRRAAEHLPAIGDAAFAPLFDRFGAAQIVLIGEASHGTSEFYRARAAITRRLIEHHGFTIVAAEADWPDAARLDAYARFEAAPPTPEEAFARFPTWMWRNHEVADFIGWLRTFNLAADPDQRVEFRGLDLYGMGASQRAVLDYLDKVDPEAAKAARERYGCLTPWQDDPSLYGRTAMQTGEAPCERQVVRTLTELLEKRLDYLAHDGEAFFDAAQNARLVRAAERYYRIMYRGSVESWNLRDRHMYETLQAVLAHRGPDAKAVVWAHNSHVGNAAATEMGWSGEFNIGELCRKRYGRNAVLIGMGTDRGTVAAASDWDGPMEIKTVRPSHLDSYERLCLRTGMPSFLVDLRQECGDCDAIAMLGGSRLERAIGVIYRPATERWSHYFECDLPQQFDAWIWFEETKAVSPLPAGHPHGLPETFPFGL